MSDTTIPIDPTRSVDDTIREHPETVAVFGRHGIDSCCGGDLPVTEAARRHAVDLDELLEELRRAAGA